MMFCDLGTDKKYVHVALFLHMFPVKISRHAQVFVSKRAALFQGDVTSFYGTAAVANENSLATEVLGIPDKVLQLRDGR